MIYEVKIGSELIEAEVVDSWLKLLTEAQQTIHMKYAVAGSGRKIFLFNFKFFDDYRLFDNSIIRLFDYRRLTI